MRLSTRERAMSQIRACAERPARISWMKPDVIRALTGSAAVSGGSAIIAPSTVASMKVEWRRIIKHDVCKQQHRTFRIQESLWCRQVDGSCAQIPHVLHSSSASCALCLSIDHMPKLRMSRLRTIRTLLSAIVLCLSALSSHLAVFEHLIEKK
jgi:hypothetical protein